VSKLSPARFVDLGDSTPAAKGTDRLKIKVASTTVRKWTLPFGAGVN
jgi:hypothetical protein